LVLPFLIYAIIIFSFGIILLIGCNQEKFPASKFESYPDTATVNEKIFYRQAIDRRVPIYNLPTITKGSNDSLVIRFWPRHAFEPFENMFEFRLDSNGWKGYHYCAYSFLNQDGVINHPYGYENLGDSVFIVKQILPKCDWSKFSDSLNFFEVKALPTQSHIKNFQEIRFRDGYSYSFEIGTKKTYRWIHYDIPDSYPYKECQQIVGLVKMFIRQFESDYYWPEKLKSKN
jgi:hypothetical protein